MQKTSNHKGHEGTRSQCILPAFPWCSLYALCITIRQILLDSRKIYPPQPRAAALHKDSRFGCGLPRCGKKDLPFVAIQRLAREVIQRECQQCECDYSKPVGILQELYLCAPGNCAFFQPPGFFHQFDGDSNQANDAASRN